MPSFNLWAPEFELKPSPLACGLSVLLTLLALSSMLLLPLRGLWILLLAGVILAVTIQKILQQVFLLGDDAVMRVYYRDSGWWLVARNGFEYPATLRPDSVVSQWFILLNFNMDKQENNEESGFKLKKIVESLRSTGIKNFISGKKKSVLILPDGLLTHASHGQLLESGKDENREDFRRLKVFLRFGKGIG